MNPSSSSHLPAASVLRALLIDDEILAREELRRMLAAHPEISIVGEAGRMAEARAALEAGGYDLVFLDIQLRGGTGFDLVPSVVPPARIIFVTAHDRFALRAFEVNALDYLLKPVRADRFAAALSRARAGAAPDSPPRGAAPVPKLELQDLVHLKIGNGTTRFAALRDIVAVEAEANYSAVILADGPRLFVRRTMKSWEDDLPATHFVRVHRSTIVNLSRYGGSDRQTDETTLLHLRGHGEPVRASYRYLPELRTRLAALGLQL